MWITFRYVKQTLVLGFHWLLSSRWGGGGSLLTVCTLGMLVWWHISCLSQYWGGWCFRPHCATQTMSSKTSVFCRLPNTESKGHVFYKTIFIFSHYLCGIWGCVNKVTQVQPSHPAHWGEVIWALCAFPSWDMPFQIN